MEEAPKKRARKPKKTEDFVSFDDEQLKEIVQPVKPKATYFDAKQILAERVDDEGKLQFLIDWLPEGQYDPTWEPENFANRLLIFTWRLRRDGIQPMRVRRGECLCGMIVGSFL